MLFIAISQLRFFQIFQIVSCINSTGPDNCDFILQVVPSDQMSVTKYGAPPLFYIQYKSSATEGRVKGGRSHQMSITKYRAPPLFYIQYKSFVTQGKVKGGRSHQMSITKYRAPPLFSIQYKSSATQAE